MRDFPSCFGENGVQVADASCSSVGVTKAPQNLVTCVYQCKLLGKYCLITVVWTKSLMGQCLSVEIDDMSHQCLCKVDVKPSLFSKRKGSRSLEANSCKIDIHWDFSLAKFGSGPEPVEGYYLAVVCKGQMVLSIGDLRKEAFKKSNATPSFKCYRVFGTKAQFCYAGPIHDITIECDSSVIDDPCLLVRIDSKTVMQVKHLRWKFRGNYTILIDGLPVEVFWDVHNWLFSSNFGNAVFMFQTCLSAEKLWTTQTLSDSSVMPWPYTESTLSNSKSPDLGFSLVLYVWKNE
ncbi:unnamed protein product [Withania somnifera]